MNWNIKIRREKRKSLKIQILEGGIILVVAPLGTPYSEIDNFLYRHRRWINRRIAIFSNDNQFYKIEAGGFCTILGQKYTIRLVDVKKVQLVGSECFMPFAYKDKLHEELRKFLMKKAKLYLRQRLDFWAAKMNITYNKFRLSSATTRWGSASSQRNINIVWRLIAAPQNVIDYVVVHELAHLRFFNHSQKFWNLVKKFMPDYNNHKQWLMENGHKLKF